MIANEWDEYAQDWDENPQTTFYAAKAFNELVKQVDLKGLRVLDFGCGTGLLTEKLSPHVKEIVALDGSSKMIESLKRKNLSNVTPIASFLTAELLETNPSLHNNFDLIVASSVCAFLPDYSETLALLRSTLSKGGTYVQWDWLISEGEDATGFDINTLQSTLASTMSNEVQITTPFEIDDMSVVMAVVNI